MARPTGSAAKLLVNVHEMQVPFLVPEFGDSDSLLRGHGFLDMTLETQRIGLYVKRSVELLRVVLGQPIPPRRSVRDVAGSTLPVTDRSVVPGIFFEQEGHIRKQATIVRAQRLVMAGKTESFLSLGEQIGQHATVTGVAGVAGIRPLQGSVDHRGRLDQCADVVMIMA